MHRFAGGGVVCLAVFCVSVWGQIPVQEITTSSSTNTSSTATTTTTTKKPGPSAATLTPPKKINYTLELDNDGPTTLDGVITFRARLKDDKGKEAQSSMFRYEWSSNADQKLTTTEADLESSINNTYKSDRIKPGPYVFTVAVYSKDTMQIVDFKSMKFVLTEYLNGELTLKQNLQYQRHPDIFSTKVTIDLVANHSDRFSSKFPKPVFQFMWFQNNEFMETTSSSAYNLRIREKGNYTLESDVYALFPRLEFDRKLLSELPSLGAAPCGSKKENSLIEKIERRVSDKCGKFLRKITLKDPVMNVYIDGDRSVVVGSYATMNITCAGSFPTSLCWNVTALNSTEPNLNNTCKPDQFLDTCEHKAHIKITETGWKTIWFTLYNDVSYYTFSFDVNGYDGEPVNVPALTIPVVFCVLGSIIIIIGAVYLNRLRKKPVVEIADFDFHPSLSDSASVNPLSMLVNRIKLKIYRNRYKQTHNRPEHHETTAKQYGATDMYDSL